MASYHSTAQLTLTRSALEATAVLRPAARQASTRARAPSCPMPAPASASQGKVRQQNETSQHNAAAHAADYC